MTTDANKQQVSQHNTVKKKVTTNFFLNVWLFVEKLKTMHVLSIKKTYQLKSLVGPWKQCQKDLAWQISHRVKVNFM